MLATAVFDEVQVAVTVPEPLDAEKVRVDPTAAVKVPDPCPVHPVHEMVRLPVCVLTVKVVVPLMFP